MKKNVSNVDDHCSTHISFSERCVTQFPSKYLQKSSSEKGPKEKTICEGSAAADEGRPSLPGSQNFQQHVPLTRKWPIVNQKPSAAHLHSIHCHQSSTFWEASRNRHSDAIETLYVVMLWWGQSQKEGRRYLRRSGASAHFLDSYIIRWWSFMGGRFFRESSEA